MIRLPFIHVLDGFNWLLLGLAAVMLVFLLAVPQIVGIGDNGDWYKLMQPTGFTHLPDPPKDARYFVNEVAFAPFSTGLLVSGHLVSGLVVASVARIIGPILSSNGNFPLPVIGLLNACVLLFGLALILAATQSLESPRRRMLGVLLVFFFTDIGYAAFLNSFYTQTASLLFLLITAGGFLLLLKTRTTMWYAVFVFAAVLFVTSKAQEAPQSMLLGVLVVKGARLTGLRRPLATGIALAIVLVCLAGFTAMRANDGLHDSCLYNQVFDDLLRYSSDAAADLRTLGLDSELVQYRAHHAFEPGSPVNNSEFRSRFFEKFDYPDLFVFYFRNPERLWQLLARRAERAFTLVTQYGNYDRSLGRPAWANIGRL